MASFIFARGPEDVSYSTSCAQLCFLVRMQTTIALVHLTLCSFTGAYVFYWLLLLLLYMTAYFISSKEAEDTPSTGAAAQVLRQVVIFVIASKGYLDYVIWFAVNSIEWGQRDRRQDNRNESADVDVDLSPQVTSSF